MNPETCPFTFEDIQTCKDISFEKVKKDYQQLCNFDALTNPRKFCGNPTLYYYQFRNLINCCRENGKTIKEVFDKPEDIDALWKETIKRNKKDKDPLCSAVDMYECQLYSSKLQQRNIFINYLMLKMSLILLLDGEVVCSVLCLWE